MWIYVLMCVLRLVEAEEGIWSLGTKVPGDCEPLEVDAGTQALVLMIEQHIHNHGYIQPPAYFLSLCACLMKWTDETCRPLWLASSTGHVFKGRLSVFYVLPCLRNIPFAYHLICLVISGWAFGLLLRTIMFRFRCGRGALLKVDV